MKRGLKLVVSWLCILSMFLGFLPGNLFLNSTYAAANDLIWPNPGAVNLTKKADPAGQGQWDITLTVEGKNIKTTSDVVLVIDRSGSMDQSKRMTNAKTAANKFVDNLLIKDSTTRIAVVTFDKTASEKSSFAGYGQKDSLKKVIDAITVSNEGTNIQAGLNKARGMLAGSQAQNKVIVLLSDGAPTYSYKASHAAAYNWPEKKYNFTLYDFGYNGDVLGNGSKYALDKGFLGWGGEVYTVDGKKVEDNGIAALSEAKLAWDGGIGIYSIGLEVGNDPDAKYVLNNVQNKGYYSSNSADLGKVFSELSGQIAYAAQKAIVTDPMGDMFDLVGKPTVSQGTITWDDKTETFKWDAGNIIEGSPATLTYRVKMDQSKHPDPNTLYPTNGTTTIDYTDIHGNNVKKNFVVPQVSYGKGSITVKGYRVNADGQPVNAEGVVVERPELAQQLYSGAFAQDGKEALDIGNTYSVDAPTIEGYQLEAGDDPTSVKLTMKEPTPTVWFGFMEAVAQHVTVKYLDKETNKALAEPTDVTGLKGKQIELEAKKVLGYTPEKASDKYTFTGKEGQEYTFYYTADKQTVTVKYLERGTDKELKAPATEEGATDKAITIVAPAIPGYAPEQPSLTYKFTAEKNQEVVLYYNATEQQVTVQHLVEGTNKELVQPTIKGGHTGEEVNVALEIPGYTPVKGTETYTFNGDEKQSHTVYYTADKQTVTIRYVDQDTKKEIQLPTTQDGVTDQEIKLTAPAIDGYTPVASEVSYKFTADEKQVVTLYYKAIEQQVTVKHVVKGTEKELADPTTHKGHKGEKVNVAKEIEGYTPVEGTETYTFTTDKDQSHTVYYTADKQTVTIRYVDQDTNQEISEPTTQEGVTDQSITIEAPAITGYTPVDPEVEYKFTADEKQVVTIYYKAIEQQVTVKHLVQGTEKELADPTTHKGHKGEKVNVAKEIEGYTPVEGTETYTFTADKDQSHTVYYTADKQTVTIRYVDQDTNKDIKDATTQEGVTDQEITLTSPSITGYTPVKPEVAYKFTADEKQEVVIYYTADQPAPEMRTITVKYLEEGTNRQLLEPASLQGEVGKEVLLKAPNIEGYVTEKPEVSYPVSSQNNQEYVFYYKKQVSEPEERTVSIHHVDQETNDRIAETTTLTGKVGETLRWSEEPITVVDAVYSPLEINHEYLITDAPEQEYTVYYKKGQDETIVQLLVRFLNKLTNEELGQKTYSGKPDEAITIKPDPITVSGAVYKPEQAEYPYRFTGEALQELIVYFIPDTAPVEKDQAVTVKYLEQGTGAELAASTVLTGKAGSTVTLTAVPVSGYTPVQSSVVYQFEDKDGQEFIFYYTKNSPVTPPVDPGPSNPSPSNPGSSSGNSGSVTPLPPAPPVVPPLPPAPPKLDTANHFNYINGYPDGMVKPENNISREEVAAIFYRLMDDATRSDYMKSTSSYKDVAATRWSSKNIATMENAGIITGYPDGTFKPGRSITRAEFAAIASRFDDLDQQENTTFSDIKGHWAEKYIVSAANKGWIKGYPDGTFKPDQYITRAEAMAFINSVLNRKVKAEGIHKAAKAWPDNTPNKWYYADVIEATNNHDYSRNADGAETWEQVKPDRVYP